MAAIVLNLEELKLDYARLRIRSRAVERRLLASLQEHGQQEPIIVAGATGGGYAAARYLLPLARANAGDCEALAGKVAGLGLSSRETGLLYRQYIYGRRSVWAQVVADPVRFLKATEAARAPVAVAGTGTTTGLPGASSNNGINSVGASALGSCIVTVVPLPNSEVITRLPSQLSAVVLA